jgi:hypothetical protein
MQIPSVALWFGCAASSTFAFSSSSFSSLHQFGLQQSRSSPASSSSISNVASSETLSVANMEKGVGGRIEDAFEAAKSKGEAAFITFITAGYPTADGTYAD